MTLDRLSIKIFPYLKKYEILIVYIRQLKTDLKTDLVKLSRFYLFFIGII